MEFNPDDLIDAVGDDRQFVRGEAPDPVQENESVYYIGVGSKGVNYTLRTRYLEWIGGRDPYRVVRDHYVKNLGPNAEGAVAKAKAYTDQTIYWHPIETRGRAKARPTNVIKFGKYEGSTLDDVVESDPGYIAWIVKAANEPNSFLASSKHKAFVREARRIAEEHPEVRRIITERQDTYEAKKKQWAEEKAERERKAASRGYFGAPKEKFETWVEYLGSASFDTDYGTMYIHRFEDDNGDLLVWKTAKALGDYDEDGQFQWYMNRSGRGGKAGDRLKIKGTVKEHSQYRDEPQAIVTRVKVLEHQVPGFVEEKRSSKQLKARLLR